MRAFGTSPSADEPGVIIARQALADIPKPFAQHLPNVLLLGAEFADDDTFFGMRIVDAFHLTGICDGPPIGDKSGDQSGGLPDRIQLFRRAILDEWVSGKDILEDLVPLVFVHEMGRQSGLGNQALCATEPSAG